MPKESLIINGFLGGINKDADQDDIISEDRQGKNELITCNEALCDQRGKVRGKTPAILSSSNLTNGTSDTDSTEDFLVHGSKYYRKQGAYRVGEEVEWSGKTIITKPTETSVGTKDARSRIQTDSIGVDMYGSSVPRAANYLFLGKMASQNENDAMLANEDTIKGESSSDTGTDGRGFVQTVIDWDNDRDYAGASDKPYFDSHFNLGWNGGTYANHGQAVAFWDEGGSQNYSSSDAIVWDVFDGSGEEGGIVANSSSNVDAGITDTDYLRMSVWNDTSGNTGFYKGSTTFGVIFRTGAMKVSSGDTSNKDGLYRDGLDITDQDINIELALNADPTSSDGGCGDFYSNLKRVTIIADSHHEDTTVYFGSGSYDGWCKIWHLSKTTLASEGARVLDGTTDPDNGGARITIPYASAVHEGHLFNSADIATFVVLLEFEDGKEIGRDDASGTKSIWAARLYEVSFAPMQRVGWARTKLACSQSKIYESSNGGKVESLARGYTNVVDMGDDTTMNMTLYEPNDDSYDGRVYYQEADDDGHGIGAMFLLADISKAKGVRTVLTEHYTTWESSRLFHTCEITAASTNITFSGSPKIHAGMRAVNTYFSDNTYVVSVDVAAETAVLSSSSGASGSVSIEFRGALSFRFPNRPAGETYQLSAGYPEQTESINAIWEHSAVNGRQAYIGNVIKTGEDIVMKIENNASSISYDNVPKLDTTGFTGSATTDIHIKITGDSASPQHYQYSTDGGSTWDGADTDVTTSYATLASGIKVKFPGSGSYIDNDEWSYTITKESDLILKGPVGKRCGFSDLQYIDLEMQGTGITAMTSSGDRLLVFSADTLNIINVAQDYEYLEATSAGHGVASPKSIVHVGEGVAFLNNTGVYFFDGSKINDLSSEKMMSLTWSNFDRISYLPSQKLIIVMGTSAGYSYSLVTGQWAGYDALVGPDTSTGFYNGNAYHITESSLKIMSLGNASSNFEVLTGMISCGDRSRKKRFKKIYINLTTSDNIQASYSIDGGEFSSPVSASDNQVLLEPNTNGKKIQIKIDTTGAPETGTEVSDIIIVYRNRSIR